MEFLWKSVIRVQNIVLVGNPNVGKTTFYNKLTGSNDHTGNWNGKTVGVSCSTFEYKGVRYRVADLPGICTLEKSSIEETVAIDYLSETEDKAIVFIDGTNIIRGLFLYYEVIKFVRNVCVVITMKDLLDKNGVVIDVEKMEKHLDCGVIYISLTEKDAIGTILDKVEEGDAVDGEDSEGVSKGIISDDEGCVGYEEDIRQQYGKCNEIVRDTTNKIYTRSKFGERVDKIFLGRKTGLPVIFLILCSLLWLSLVFSNFFQGVLYNVFGDLVLVLNELFRYIGCTEVLVNILINGGVATALFVATVMIPPMLVFFPLFAFMEETGLIPRIAFNLDGILSRFYLSGKNSISLMLGFGCNCVGVTSARIFENEKSRRVAILINNFVPCNGRLPMLFLLVYTFLTKSVYIGFCIIVLVIFCNIILALVVGRIMNIIYDNKHSEFVYELPVYKMPSIRKVVKISLRDKALPVLIKSISFSFCAGIVIFVLKSIEIEGISLINSLIILFDPIGRVMGLSGVILVAFLFGISANEIVLPIMFLLYTNYGLFSSAGSLGNLSQYGFGMSTAICMIVLSLNHYPCVSSLITIKKETNSTLFTMVCAIVPLVIGIILCIFVNVILQSLQNLLFC